MKGFGRDIQGKLKAQRGASLPLALMLFLICALLASVVLTATTAVSGRHAKLAEMDQRYYSVVSAAQLLQNEFEQYPVTIECTQVKKVTTTLSSGEAGAIDRDEEEEVQSVTLSINGNQVATGKESATVVDSAFTLSELSVLYLLIGADSDTVDFEDVWSKFDDQDFQPFNKQRFTLSPKSGLDTLDDALEADVTETAFSDGSLRLQVQSGTGTNAYALTLELEADVDSDESSVEEFDTPTDPLVEKKTVTTTRSATISWPTAIWEKKMGVTVP